MLLTQSETIKTNSKENVWESLSLLLENEIGEREFNSWIKPLQFDKIKSKKIYFFVKSRFLKDWVERNYKKTFLKILKESEFEINDVEFVINKTNTSNSVQSNLSEEVITEKSEKVYSDGSNQNKINFHNYLNKSFTFENFLTGPSNEFAFAAAKRVVNDSFVSLNPLFFYSTVGLGKTHLLHAIANEIAKTAPNRKVFCLSAEKFMFTFIKALQNKDSISFKEKFRNIDVLMIDDVQFLCGKEMVQKEFVHTFNTLINEGKQIVLSADKSPHYLTKIDEKLKSRLTGGCVVDISPADFELRLRIIKLKAELMKEHFNLAYNIDENVLELLAYRIKSNVRELEGALKRIVSYSELTKQKINIALAEKILNDIFLVSRKQITPDVVMSKTADRFNITINDMKGKGREKHISYARQIAMYLTKKLTDLSLPKIGNSFGGRDHATVIYACKKIEKEIIKNQEIKNEIAFIENTCMENI